MTEQFDGARLLIYSHDAFGLGHLRRCQLIAQSLVNRFEDLSILIVSGSPIIGSFNFPARVDFVRIPGIVRRYEGEFVSRSLQLDINQTLKIRSEIIWRTAELFQPDLFLVDKEPTGICDEIVDILPRFQNTHTRLIVGLRDVMDAPDMLRQEWNARKCVVPALEDYYDEIWVYGMREMWQPLTGIDVSEDVHRKMIYTGYLQRTVPDKLRRHPIVEAGAPYLLVTPGGGGDGFGLVDWVLRAYEADHRLPWRPVFVFGPLMDFKQQKQLMTRVDKLTRARAISFDSKFEILMANAAGVISMCGANTFGEILSFDQKAVVVPRCRPREEQLLRAREAERLGLIKMLGPDLIENTDAMIAAIRNLEYQSRPSLSLLPGMLDGLENVAERAEPHLFQRAELGVSEAAATPY